jgi:hypothetical protein
VKYYQQERRGRGRSEMEIRERRKFYFNKNLKTD